MLTPRLALLIVVVALAACTSPADHDVTTAPPPLSEAELQALVAKAGAPLFSGMGSHHHAATTASPDAQRYFDQGLVLDFAFNHAESIRSFRAAQRLDDSCAMCYWGEALASGPNINVTSKGKVVMTEAESATAWAALDKALARKGQASEAERDYIDALATRYTSDPEADREPLDLAYADAMRQLAAKYPADDDAQALFAEALMNTMPWDYWLDGENPRPRTAEVIAALETVLARSPEHPLALHLYIHAVEASTAPGRAETAADTLADLVPGTGHLVHMPAHIYWRVGRYNDASEANVRAAAVDEAYIAQCNAQGFYPAVYYPHNIHFLWAASSMEGRGAIAIDAARKVAANAHLEMIDDFPPIEIFHTIPLFALIQFGKWDEILAEPQPRADLDYSNAIWHHARATAYARTGDTAAAERERAALVPLLETESILRIDGADYPASVLLAIADHLARGEIALASSEPQAAIEHFRNAVAAQDALPYMEPPFWYYPTRQSLGEALLVGGDAAAAEEVYRRDLEDYPRNGWSLFGLAQSLERQGKGDEAAAVRKRFEQAWALADVKLTNSRI
jgi:tetratricopeptide (TPR) repeat protein